MSRINLDVLPPGRRAAVEDALTVRYRVDDGHAPSMTLAEMIESDRFTSRAIRIVGGRRRHGLLMTWPGLDEEQFLAVSGDLWRVVDLPNTSEM